MSLKFQILGKAGRDNALYLTIDSGQKVSCLLFDCGDDCLPALSVANIQAIEHLCFSHCHMDHVSGFDGFFRLNYDRLSKENHVWGPPKTSEIIQHRFQGFMWNLYEDEKSQWYVHDIHSEHISTVRFDACQAFAQAHALASKSFEKIILDTPEYQLEAYPMNHHTISMAYIVREKPSININTANLAEMGLQGGSWLQKVKNPQVTSDTLIEIQGKPYLLGELREALLVETQGQSLAYLTDFLMDATAQATLVDALKGCTYMICESQYLSADAELAQKNYHMTSQQVAETAKQAQVQELILFHVSDRYQQSGWQQLLQEAQAIFPNTRFPSDWSIT